MLVILSLDLSIGIEILIPINYLKFLIDMVLGVSPIWHTWVLGHVQARLGGATQQSGYVGGRSRLRWEFGFG